MFWILAAVAALPAVIVTAEVVIDVFDWHRLPRMHPRDVIGLLIVMAPPILFVFVAEGLRRGTRWAVGLGMTVTIGAGAVMTFFTWLLATHLSSYDDERRKEVMAVIALACLAAGMFKLAVDIARCRAYLEELRGHAVRAFEPVMGARKAADGVQDVATAGKSGGGSEGH